MEENRAWEPITELKHSRHFSLKLVTFWYLLKAFAALGQWLLFKLEDFLRCSHDSVGYRGGKTLHTAFHEGS